MTLHVKSDKIETYLFYQEDFMNILIIDACIREETSRTKKLLDQAITTIQQVHPEANIETVSLAQTNLNWFDYQSLKERDALLAQKKLEHPRFQLAHQFAQADGIVIAAPYWDASFPAILKVYIEHISVEGITFGCDNNGLHGMCNAKYMLYLTTRGSTAAEFEQATPYLKALCFQFGIPSFLDISADGLDEFNVDSNAVLQEALTNTKLLCEKL